jgi:hypothetical protein
MPITSSTQSSSGSARTSKVQNPAVLVIRRDFKVAMPHTIASGDKSEVIHRNGEVHAVTQERLFEFSVGTGSRSAMLWLRTRWGDLHLADNFVEVR